MRPWGPSVNETQKRRQTQLRKVRLQTVAYTVRAIKGISDSKHAYRDHCVDVSDACVNSCALSTRTRNPHHHAAITLFRSIVRRSSLSCSPAIARCITPSAHRSTISELSNVCAGAFYPPMHGFRSSSEPSLAGVGSAMSRSGLSTAL